MSAQPFSQCPSPGDFPCNHCVLCGLQESTWVQIGRSNAIASTANQRAAALLGQLRGLSCITGSALEWLGGADKAASLARHLSTLHHLSCDGAEITPDVGQVRMFTYG